MNEEKWPQSIMSVALNGDACAFAFYFEEHPSITLNCYFASSARVSLFLGVVVVQNSHTKLRGQSRYVRLTRRLDVFV